ncbi:MAG: MetQ/NlpA family ABC transporter substrate-binding protein [Peptoniphilaceae bacterium]|uniref:MetQ/NlpA family ABC transporter substrate-binding protein n=1 Tax=Parvimonas sp. TaxID=1944660 RepID=UPI0026015042|nr:MetQ/NlpA family ABC transporter substrate-binding protein [Parvimonas sp.]MCI5997661.1 MetQ/NlpA family ABC transporter substrate-binding protein [Parvimonas sp.]MDD7765384.1 MetQ/NlpA family ABC transporter substrate-binding protein [Peptoniphilaceae bacterium]MDY3050650.1 MetQ/NlpA family ABC transporter substrate-binding protein [Parvimonas sp.]
MKKRFLSTLLLCATLLVGCGGKTSNENKDDKAKSSIGIQKDGFTVLKIGTNAPDKPVWDAVNKNLEKDKIKLEVVVFEDYVKPNLALAQKEIDLNSFQHSIYLEDFKAKHKLDLSILNYTLVAPMGFFSNKIKSVDEIQNGSKIAIPNDATNGGRALRILQENGLLKLKEQSGLKPTVDDIIENPKNLEIIQLTAQQIPRSLDEVSLAAINSGVAVKANLKFDDAIIKENPKSEEAKNYWNLIAIRSEDKDNEILQKVKSAYQKQNVIDKLIEVNGNSAIPVFEVLP